MSEVETEKEEKTNSNSPITTAKAEAEAEVVEWTTREELLLACAVKRHGLKDWDSVAMELQTRSFLPTTLLSPQICQDKFRDLKRRFTSTTVSDDVPAAEDHAGDDVTLPWLEDLRRLRVAELKQEVQRRDLSIESLQSKVKRLEEERERSLKENVEKNENDDVKTDLAKDKSTANSIKHEEEERSENDKREGGDELADDAAGKSASGEEENRSFNESNSTNNKETGSKTEPEPVKPETEEAPKPPVPVAGEDSCNDSSDRGKMSREKKANSAELRDSVDESKEVTTTKESSDVQSSASLTRKKRRKGGEGVGSGSGGKRRSGDGGGDANTTTTTAAVKREGTVVKSEPLVGFLDIIRSHKHGSMFERRLDSQKTEKYKNVIRQHVDLQTIQTRIEDGSYTSCSNKFYLDLLLVFNNVIVFFPKSSNESLAAHALRDLVMKEIKKKNRNPSSSSSNPRPESASTKVQQPKPDSDRSGPLLAKHKSTAPLVVCRKRSSIAAKASSSSGNKVEKPAADNNNKTVSNSKPPIKASSSTQNEDDNSPIKLKLKEKPVTGVRSMRRSSKGRPINNATTTSNTNSNPNTSSSSQQQQQQQQAQPVSALKGEDSKPDKKKPELDNAAKKRGAADFLKRIKKNSPAKGSSVEASIGSPDDSKGGKSDNNQRKKVVERKDTGPMRRSGNGSGKQAKEDNSPSKRNVGRPPKKGKEAPVGKRGRDNGEGEGSSKRPNKRTRR